MTLSDKLHILAGAQGKTVPSDDGREYIEESKGFTGVKFYCLLCNVHIDAPHQRENHLKDSKHKDLYKTVKERVSVEEQLVQAKHESLSPTEEEFNAVKDIVLSCEKGLKLVSDFLTQGDKKETEAMQTEATETGENTSREETIKKELKSEGEATAAAGDKDATSDQPATGEAAGAAAADIPPRAIKGVMRAGLLANGLLMKGEVNVQLVLLCKDKPTVSLLSQVADNLPQQIATLSEQKYDVTMEPENACIVVTAQKHPKATCKISLTSPLMRTHPFKYFNELAHPDPADMLPGNVCEGALRELRRARWFEAKAYALPFCEIVMRVFRDLCNRVPTWSHLDIWLLELVVQKCLGTLEMNAKASMAVLRVFESIAGGILLPDSPGVYDPCEREPTDLCTKMTLQEREDITASAQHALRLMAFQQIHKILDMPSLSSDPKSGGKRKRSETEAL